MKKANDNEIVLEVSADNEGKFICGELKYDENICLDLPKFEHAWIELAFKAVEHCAGCIVLNDPNNKGKNEKEMEDLVEHYLVKIVNRINSGLKYSK